jgi:hypothetical protein
VAPAAPVRGRNGEQVKSEHHGTNQRATPRDWRRIHHTPAFWIGIVLCLAAIALYVMSYDLSWPWAR